MAEEKHHHHLFHHKKDEEDKPIESVYTESETTTGYADTGFSSGGPGGYGESTVEGYGATTISTESEVDYRKEEKHHKHLEQLGEMGAVAAGAYALVIIYIYIYIYNLLNLLYGTDFVLSLLTSLIIIRLKFFLFFRIMI